MVSDFYICRNIYVCTLSTGVEPLPGVTFILKAPTSFAQGAAQMPLSVILGLTTIAQLMVFWQAEKQAKNKATPQHAEPLPSSLFTLDVRDNH